MPILLQILPSLIKHKYLDRLPADEQITEEVKLKMELVQSLTEP